MELKKKFLSHDTLPHFAPKLNTIYRKHVIKIEHVSTERQERSSNHKGGK